MLMSIIGFPKKATEAAAVSESARYDQGMTIHNTYSYIIRIVLCIMDNTVGFGPYCFEIICENNT